MWLVKSWNLKPENVVDEKQPKLEMTGVKTELVDTGVVPSY